MTTILTKEGAFDWDFLMQKLTEKFLDVVNRGTFTLTNGLFEFESCDNPHMVLLATGANTHDEARSVVVKELIRREFNTVYGVNAYGGDISGKIETWIPNRTAQSLQKKTPLGCEDLSVLVDATSTRFIGKTCPFDTHADDPCCGNWCPHFRATNVGTLEGYLNITICQGTELRNVKIVTK